MSTSRYFDRICGIVMVITLIVTVLFMNGQSIGIELVVDADSEAHSDSEYFTENDQLADWDTSSATYITLEGDDISISGRNAYEYDGSVVISGSGRYVITGTLDDGSVCVDANANSKVWILLNGVDISCSDNACLRVDEADKVFLTLAEGTSNTLTGSGELSEEALEDGTYGIIFAHDDLTINGSGSLQIRAGYKHGIKANDDLVITGGTITIDAVADGIHVNDSFRMKDASVVITAGDDGILTENAESFFYLESGDITIAAEGDGIHSNGDVILAGGRITMDAGDDGIHAEGNVEIEAGTIAMNSCYEGIEGAAITVSGGEITIYPTDDGFNASSGSTSQEGMFANPGGGPGGNPGEIAGANPRENAGVNSGEIPGNMDAAENGMQPPEGMEASSEDGMQLPAGMEASAEGGMLPPAGMEASSEGGMLPPTGMEASAEGGMQFPAGMEASAEDGMQFPEAGSMPELRQEDGTEQQETQEDVENYIRISGGTITIINKNGYDADGLDSNGDIFITGGDIRISLSNNGTNSAIDAAAENGGVAEITGGTVIACGSSSMAEGFDSTSTQCSFMYNISAGLEAGTSLIVKDEEGTEILSWEVPCSFSSAVISSPDLQIGETCTVLAGENEETIMLSEMSNISGESGDVSSESPARMSEERAPGKPGEAGVPGESGTSAEASFPGDSGESVEAGMTEVPGDTGEAGLPGESGDTGEAGLPGKPGESEKSGEPGETQGSAEGIVSPDGIVSGQARADLSAAKKTEAGEAFYSKKEWILTIFSFLALGAGLFIAGKYRRH